MKTKLLNKINHNLMRAFHFFILISFCILIFSCSEHDPIQKPTMPFYWGSVNALFNGNPWNPNPFCQESAWNESTLDIVMDRKSINGVLREHLNVSNVPMILGVHQIITRTSATTLGPGAFFGISFSDVAGDFFKYQPSLGNSFIEIVEWDSITGQISGSFDNKVLRNSGDILNPEYPDTLKIVGYFSTRFDKRN